MRSVTKTSRSKARSGVLFQSCRVEELQVEELQVEELQVAKLLVSGLRVSNSETEPETLKL
jgi:hypothetical protein